MTRLAVIKVTEDGLGTLLVEGLKTYLGEVNNRTLAEIQDTYKLHGFKVRIESTDRNSGM
jgi:hypothetical protein